MSRKYGGRGRVVRATRALLNKNNIALIAIGDDVGLIDWKRCRNVVPSNMVMGSLKNVPHIWTMYGVVCCRDDTGKPYVATTSAVLQDQRYLSQIQGHQNCGGCKYCHGLAPDDPERESPFQPFLDAHVDSCNPNHIIRSGYIATPYPSDITDEQMMKLYELTGVWKPDYEGKHSGTSIYFWET